MKYLQKSFTLAVTDRHAKRTAFDLSLESIEMNERRRLAWGRRRRFIMEDEMSRGVTAY